MNGWVPLQIKPFLTSPSTRKNLAQPTDENLRSNPSSTVRLLIHVLRQPTFFLSSLLSAVTVDLPRSCVVRTGIA